jgi:hypothetical protein
MKRALVTTLLAAAIACQAPIVLGNVETAADAAHAIGVDTHIVRTAVHARTDPRSYIERRASRAGWRGSQWRCLEAILVMESNFRPRARNGSHYGVFQEHNLAPGTGLVTQTRRGLRYIAERYGTPCTALDFHLAHHWY